MTHIKKGLNDISGMAETIRQILHTGCPSLWMTNHP